MVDRRWDGEACARTFHEIYERLAPSFGYETRTDTREFDPSSKNGRLMIAVCAEVIALLREDTDRIDKLERLAQFAELPVGALVSAVVYDQKWTLRQAIDAIDDAKPVMEIAARP